MKIAQLLKWRLGPRTILKSFLVYLKTKAYDNGQPLSAFLVNGNTLIDLKSNAHVANKGVFHLGVIATNFEISTSRCALRMWENTTLQINGTVFAGPGVSISLVEDGGLLEMGTNVNINSNSRLICRKHIKIGNNVFISWDVEIRDTDFHKILKDNF